MTTTTTNYTINTLPKTKKEIVERLFKDGHVNLDEVLELMKEPLKATIQPDPLPAKQPPFGPFPGQIPNPIKSPWDTKPFGKIWYTTSQLGGDTWKD